MTNNIIEIDGPPMAYFLEGDERNTYKTFAVKGRPDQVVMVIQHTIDHIKSALSSGIIYWRLRPEFFDFDALEADGFYRMRFRLTTSPQLSDEFWSGLITHKPEGGSIAIAINKEPDNAKD